MSGDWAAGLQPGIVRYCVDTVLVVAFALFQRRFVQSFMRAGIK